jgi:hypothetical protein
MQFIKQSLTLLETLRFIDMVVDNCFTQDEKGNDIEYTPQYKYPALKEAIAIFYTDYEKTDDIVANYETYKSLNINTDFEGYEQFYEMTRAIDERIEFRKQKMLNSDNVVSKFVTDLLKEQIETVKLQKKVIQQAEKLNKQFTPEEIKAMNENIAILNKNVNSPEFQKGIVEAIDTIKPFKRPQDYKKSKKVK